MLDIKLYINMISVERGTDKWWGARGCREANLKERLEKDTFKKLERGWAENLDFHYFFAKLRYLTFRMRNIIFIIRKMLFNPMNTL